MVVEEWSPVFLKKPQFVIVAMLCDGKVVDKDDLEFIRYIEAEGLNIQDFTESLLNTGLIALNGSKLELITEMCHCAILPNHKYVAAENNTGRLYRWIERQLELTKKATSKNSSERISNRLDI